VGVLTLYHAQADVETCKTTKTASEVCRMRSRQPL
jgi:hypothetical protein